MSPAEPDAVFPRGVMDPFCPREHVIETTTDHRILWHLEAELALSGDPRMRAAGVNLRRYLNVACQHHWHDHDPEPDVSAHRQCMWCHRVEWIEPPELPTNVQLHLADGTTVSPPLRYAGVVEGQHLWLVLAPPGVGIMVRRISADTLPARTSLSVQVS